VAEYFRARVLDRVDLIAIVLLSSLLVIQVAQLVLGYSARSYVIAKADFVFDRYLEETWMLDNGMAEADAAFVDAMPTFRRHRPEVDCNLRHLVITVLVKGNVDTRPIFAAIQDSLNRVVRAKRQIEQSVTPITLADLSLTPYPWFKPLDLLSALVLSASILGWMFFPLRFRERVK
jgi:hypothetical protein